MNVHKALIRRTQNGRRLLAVPSEEADSLLASGRAVAINARLLREVEEDPATYQTKVMKPSKKRKGRMQ